MSRTSHEKVTLITEVRSNGEFGLTGEGLNEEDELFLQFSPGSTGAAECVREYECEWCRAACSCVCTLHLKHLNDVDYFSLMKATQTVFDFRSKCCDYAGGLSSSFFPQRIHSLSENRGHTRSDPLNPA